MTMMTFIRHGETDGNRSRIIQGHLDCPLNETGRSQSQRLAERIKSWRQPPAALYASTLSRAAETAAIIGEPLGVTPTLKPNLREMGFGALEGKSRAAIEQSQGVNFLNDLFKDMTSDQPVEGGESPRQVLDRFSATVAELRSLHPEPDAHIAVVTHGLVLRKYLHQLMGIPSGPPKFRFGNTAITQVTFSGENCYFGAIGDTAHLE